MNHFTAEHLVIKVRESLTSRGLESPRVSIYETGLAMAQGIWPDEWEKILKYYKEYCEKADYIAAYVDEDGELKYHKQVYRQPSLNYEMCLLGLATTPRVSVTYEGCGMRDFTFTVFHEIAHILYETRDEVTCNSFALLYNNLLWTPRISPTAEKE